MSAKSTTSRIALTMFCAGALSFGMAPAAMAVPGEPVTQPTGNTAVVNVDGSWYESVLDVVNNLNFTADAKNGASTSLHIDNQSQHTVTIEVVSYHGHGGNENEKLTPTIEAGRATTLTAENGGVKHWSTAKLTAIDGKPLPHPIELVTDGVVVHRTPNQVEQVVEQNAPKPEPEPEAPAASSVPIVTSTPDPEPVVNTKTKDVKREVEKKRSDEAKPEPISKLDDTDKGAKTPGKNGKPEALKPEPEAGTDKDRKEPVKGNKAPFVSQAPELPNGKVPGNPDKPGLTPSRPDKNKAMTNVVVPNAPVITGGVRQPLVGQQASFTGGTEVTQHVATSYGPVLMGGQRQPLVGERSSFVGSGQATVVDVTDANYGPVLVSGSRPEVVGQATEAFTGQATGVPATPLTPATASVPATALTPANTVSIPVEVPATATTPVHTESAKPSRSKARTEVKAAEAHDTTEQLAHTGADETAALAALALALMGTGITLVGLKRRQTA